MSKQIKKTVFLTEPEFALCCSAAGIRQVQGFRFRSAAPMGRAETAEGLGSLAARGLLLPGEGRLNLSPELSGAFRVLRQAGRYLELIQTPGETASPCCLLFCAGGHMVSLRPGYPEGEYAGVTLYGTGELEEWLEDQQLLLPDHPDPELLAGLEPMDFPDRALREFLEQTAWPVREDAWQNPVPPEVRACLNGRSAADGALLRRIYLVRQPLCDGIVAGGPEGVTAQLYSAGALAAAVEHFWTREGENR